MTRTATGAAYWHHHVVAVTLAPGSEDVIANLTDGSVSIFLDGFPPPGASVLEEVLWQMVVPGWEGTDPSWQVYGEFEDPADGLPVVIWTHLWALAREQRVDFLNRLRAHLEASGVAAELRVVDGDPF